MTIDRTYYDRNTSELLIMDNAIKTNTILSFGIQSPKYVKLILIITLNFFTIISHI